MSARPSWLTSLEDTPTQIKLFIYGDFGVGKTPLAGSACLVDDMKEVLFIDAEAGVASLRSAGFDGQLDVARVTKFSQLQEIASYLNKGDHNYRTVVVDTIDEVQRMSLQEILDKAAAKDPRRDPLQSTLADWGRSLEETRRFVRFFRSLPMHIIFTCHERESKNEATGIIMPQIAMSGRAVEEVPAYFDIVGRLTVTVNREGKEVRAIRFKASQIVRARDRFFALPAVMEDPTMQKIYNYIVGRYPKDVEDPTSVDDALGYAEEKEQDSGEAD